jgi:carbon-monoxide dehydrogenase medium subunit
VRPFELVEPRSLDEALAGLASDPDTRPIAGGTAMLVMIKQGVFRPERLLNLARIPEGRQITFDPQAGLQIGALVTIGEVAAHPAVRQHYPALAHACHVVANIRIRNLATMGGNLAHADHQSDPPTVLSMLGAKVRLRSATGSREEPVETFLLSSYTTLLEPDELVTDVLVPVPSGGATTYVKFTTGSSEERPCAGVALSVDLADGRFHDIRLVVGAVSPAPVRVTDAETIARDQPATAELAAAVGQAAAAAIDPISDLRGSAAYKRRLVAALVRRSMLELSAPQ